MLEPTDLLINQYAHFAGRRMRRIPLYYLMGVRWHSQGPFGAWYYLLPDEINHKVLDDGTGTQIYYTSLSGCKPMT